MPPPPRALPWLRKEIRYAPRPAPCGDNCEAWPSRATPRLPRARGAAVPAQTQACDPDGRGGCFLRASQGVHWAPARVRGAPRRSLLRGPEERAGSGLPRADRAPPRLSPADIPQRGGGGGGNAAGAGGGGGGGGGGGRDGVEASRIGAAPPARHDGRQIRLWPGIKQ